MDKDDPLSVLEEIGIVIFRQESIARKAMDIYMDVGDPMKEPVPRAWGVFMTMLENDNRIEDAFNHGFAAVLNDVIRFARNRGLRHEDAEDVAQVVGLGAWNSFERYAPWRLPWPAWIMMIASRKINRYLRQVYTDREYLWYIEDISLPPATITVQVDTPAVQRVAVRWINEYDGPRQVFARRLLQIATGEAPWIGPQGTKMQDITGVSSRQYLHTWFSEFAKEVKIESNR